MAANSTPSRASAAPAAADCRSPRAVSSRSASGFESCGTASPCRRSQSCWATDRNVTGPALVKGPGAPEPEVDDAPQVAGGRREPVMQSAARWFGLLRGPDRRAHPDLAVRRGPAHAVAALVVVLGAQPVDAVVVGRDRAQELERLALAARGEDLHLRLRHRRADAAPQHV